MICPKCQMVWPEELKAVLKFCGACGAPMSEPALAAAPVTPASQPGGELRFVTLVFADLAGFTAYAEDRAPDEVARIVGDLLQRLALVVEQHGGGVDKFLGDAIVATFGLPRPDPNAARNAVRAGLAMQAAAARFNEENGLSFGLRVGIHAGEVMFRAIGGSWTVMGDTVNTTSRIQSAATPGKVWISRPVYEEVRRFFVNLPRPAVELKGKRHSVQPYEVIEERHTPFMNLPPFVGRQAEWDRILAELRQAVDARGLRVVLLRGAAGIGKSRLAWELRDWIQRESQVYRVNVVQFDAGQRLPSHGLNSIIRSRFDLPLDLDSAAVLARLRERMPLENPAAGERADLAAEFFAFVIGISDDHFRTAAMDGKSRWEGAFVEIKAWLEAVSQEEPGVYFLEDAQKGDADTAAFVDWALRVPWRSPNLLLITLREEDFGPECYWYPAITRWIQTGQVVEIRLQEIATPDLARALSGMLEGEVSPELARRIAEHTEGNPLFAIELAMLLKETGQLNVDFERGGLALPGSVREVMEARIERLGYDGKEVAKRGSLMGRRFTREAVERTWERSLPEMDSGYSILHETETIYEEESRLFAGKQEDVFRHGRLQEAVLARIPREERLKWLKQLENWALAQLPSSPSPLRGLAAGGARGAGSVKGAVDEDNWAAAGALLIPLIARSREEQHDTAQASLWHEVLALLHQRSYRNREAVSAFHNALKGASGVRRLVLASLAAQAEIFDGDGEAALRTIDAAFTSATPGPVEGEGRDLAHVVGQISPFILPPLPTWGGAGGGADFPPILRQLLDELAGDALARWTELSETEAAAALRLARGNVLTYLGRVDEARQEYQALGAALDGVQSATGRRLLLRWGRSWAYLLSELIGRQQEAEAVCQYLLQYPGLRDPAFQDEWHAFLATEGMVAERLGRYTQAMEIADRRLQHALEQSDLRSQGQIWNIKGIISHLVGDLDRAADGYQRARDISRLIGDRRGEVIGVYNLAGIYIDQLKLDQAAQQIEQYLALSRITGNRLAEAYAPISFSNVALERGDYERAAQLIAQAGQAAEHNGWPALVEMSRTSLAVINLYRWLDGGEAACLEQACQVMQANAAGSLDEIETEYFTLMILTLSFAGQGAAAQAALAHLRTRQDAAGLADRCWLELVENALARAPLDGVHAQFLDLGFLRAARFVEKVQIKIA